MQLSRLLPFPGVPGPMRTRRRQEDIVSLFLRHILSSRIKNEMEKETQYIYAEKVKGNESRLERCEKKCENLGDTW